MERIKEIIAAESLSSVMTLPSSFMGKELVVTVTPVEDKKVINKKGLTEKLFGCIPDLGMTLEELKEERLKKYEIID